LYIIKTPCDTFLGNFINSTHADSDFRANMGSIWTVNSKTGTTLYFLTKQNHFKLVDCGVNARGFLSSAFNNT